MTLSIAGLRSICRCRQRSHPILDGDVAAFSTSDDGKIVVAIPTGHAGILGTDPDQPAIVELQRPIALPTSDTRSPPSPLREKARSPSGMDRAP
ncbi:MAG: hypothetical protein R2710_04250 [Acidimicrobiales bacterium]